MNIFFCLTLYTSRVKSLFRKTYIMHTINLVGKACKSTRKHSQKKRKETESQ